MKPLKELTKDVERDLVINIVLSVRHKRISLIHAGEIAKVFVASFPFKDYQELFEKLYVLSNKYKEVRKVYVKYSPIYEKEKDEEKLKEMRKYMKINDIDSAIKIAKGAGYG